MKTRILLFSILVLFFFRSVAQERHLLNLRQAVEFARSSSVEAEAARNLMNVAYWNYKNFSSGFLPKLFLAGTFPDYYRSINSVTQPNGEIRFIRQNIAASSVDLNLTQNIGLTGGQLTLGSRVNRIDNFGDYRTRSYTTVPVTISYYQQNLFFNEFKWRKKIEPIRFKESQKTYNEAVEEISYKTVIQFFDLLSAQVQLELDRQNLSNIDTLYKVSQARSELGTVTKNDILQVQVSLVSAKSAWNGSSLNYQMLRDKFKQYIGNQHSVGLELERPTQTMDFLISKDQALAMASKNRKFNLEFLRRKAEAEMELVRAKSESSPMFSIKANLGLTQTGETFLDSYKAPLSNQAVSLGFSIPILDWGVNRSARKRAQANLDMEQSLINQQDAYFKLQIVAAVDRWNSQKDILQLALEYQDLAMQRYQIAKQKYGLGSLSFTDFNIAQLDKDRSVLEYIRALREHWMLYYEIRTLTLFDFDGNQEISNTIPGFGE